MADKEDNSKERAKAKVKKMEDLKKKREDRKGNQLCRTHNGAHLWKDCPNNPKNQGRGNSFRGMGRGHDSMSFHCNFNRGRGFQGRGFQGRGFGQGRGQPQEQYYFNHQKGSDGSTMATTPSHDNSHDWDTHTSNESYHIDNYYQGMYHYRPY